MIKRIPIEKGSPLSKANRRVGLQASFEAGCYYVISLHFPLFKSEASLVTEQGQLSRPVPSIAMELFTDWQPHEKKVVMKLTLVRHGETVANRDRIVQGQTPGELTDFGREQARRLGKRLASQRWDAFYCSDLTRTQQTARELLSGAGADISAVMEGADADVTDASVVIPGDMVSKSLGETRKGAFPRIMSMRILRERSAGELEGGPSGCVEAASKAAGAEWRSFRPAKGESWEDVQARADRFLRWLVHSHLSASKPITERPDGSLESVPVLEALNGGLAGPRNEQHTGNSEPVPWFLADLREHSRAANEPRPFEATFPRHMPRSSSFHSIVPDAKPVESTSRRRVLRSGSFSGELQPAGQILGIPRSNSSNEMAPRVAGVKRAGSFNALAPKVMKRVGSLGLSRMFLEGGQDEGQSEGGGSEKPEGGALMKVEAENNGVRVDVSAMDQDRVRGATNGERNEDGTRFHNEKMLVYDFEVGGESSRGTPATSGSCMRGEGECEKARAHSSLEVDADLGPHLHSHSVQQPADERKGCPERRMFGQGTAGEGRAKRKAGRPRVFRVLAVTHGGFIKEFVNAAMAYAEGPNLNRTRLQTRQSLSWRKRLNPAQALESKGGFVNGALASMQGLGLRGANMNGAPVQIQRTIGHNDFVSIRAVHESGKSEVLSAADWARKLDLDVLIPSKRLCFDRDKMLAEKQEVEAPAQSLKENSSRPLDGVDFDGIGGTHVGGSKSAAVYPGRPRNASVYEFEIKRLEGRDGTPDFTVKMIRENDVYHLNGLVPTRAFRSPQSNRHVEQKVLWQSPVAKLLD